MDQSCSCGKVNKLHHTPNDCGTKLLCKKKDSPSDDQVCASNCMNGDHLTSAEEQFSVNLASKDSAGQHSMSSSFSNENAASTIILESNRKDSDVSTQSSNAVACGDHISPKFDVSSDTGPPQITRSSRLDAGTPCVKQKCMAESSCSNSMHAVLPVASSNDSCQETSTEAKSSDPLTGGSSSSVPAGFEFGSVELATRCAASAMDAETTQNAANRTRTRSKTKASEINRHPNAFVAKAGGDSKSSLQKQRNDNEVGAYKAKRFQEDHALGFPNEGGKPSEENGSIYDGTSDCTSLNEVSNGHAISDGVVHIGVKNEFCCLTETKEEALSFYGKVDDASGCLLDPRKSIKNEQFSVSQCSSKTLDPTGTYAVSALSHVEKLPESINVIPGGIATAGHSACASGFDLNEVIHTNESYGEKRSACGSRFFCNVIRVVAKCGVPPNYPMNPLKFGGELGWRGSAATSAFRPIDLKHSDGNPSACNSDGSLVKSKGFIGFDLNVAAVEDSGACKVDGELGVPPVHLVQESSSKFSSSRAERLDIDLNCLGDNTDVAPRASLQIKSPQNLMLDINLNDYPSSAYTPNDVYQQYKSSQQHMNRIPPDSTAVPFAANFRENHHSFVQPAYWTDLNSIQFFGQAQTRPILFATPNLIPGDEQMQKVVASQPRLPYIIQTLPSSSCPSSSSPFFISPNGTTISSSVHYYPGTVPYGKDPRVLSAFPHFIHESMPPSFLGTPHLMQVGHGGRSHDEVANKKSISDVVNGQSVAVDECPRDNREYHLLYPSKCITAEAQMKSSHHGALGANIPLKRREPDGGWDSYQLVGNNKQLSSRN